MTTTRADVYAVSAPRPHVGLVVAHRSLRALIIELLERDRGCWTVSAIGSVSEIGHDASLHPDLAIVDTAVIATVRRQLSPTFALARVVVIGPEPDPAYRQAAVRFGVGEWLSRDCIAEELCSALHSALAYTISSQARAVGANLLTSETLEFARPDACEPVRNVPQSESVDATDA